MNLSSNSDSGSAVFADQFGPDAVPVIGTKVPTLDRSAGRYLNCPGVGRGRLPVRVPVLPLPDLRVAFSPNGQPQLLDRERPFGTEVFVKGHDRTVADARVDVNSNSYRTDGYARPMGWDEIQAHRRKRLQQAADRFGGKAELGRKLGYADGSYVGQMIRGERIVSEETVTQVEALPGLSGWFGPAPVSEAWPFPLVAKDKWENLTEQEKGAVQAVINATIDRYQSRSVRPTKASTSPPATATLIPRTGGARRRESWLGKKQETAKKAKVR
jgi:hypothetical protein